MNAREAHADNGQIILGAWTELTNGMSVTVSLSNSEGDSLSDTGRAALHRSIERGRGQLERGEVVDAEEVLAELER